MGNCCKKKNGTKNKENIEYNDENNENEEKFIKQDDLLEIKDNQTNNSDLIAETNFNNDKDAIKIGLENIGATCYMNATLQCLSNTKDLNNYFLKKYKYNKNAENKRLSNEFYNVMKNLWNKKRKGTAYAPKEFKETISQMNSLFEGVQANDSKDLINFLLEQMHEELNNKSKNNNNDTDFSLTVNMQLDPYKLYEYFLQNYQKNFNSIISDSFYGFTQTEIICQNCQKVKYNYDIFSFIEFPLEQVNIFFRKTLPQINYQLQQPDINIYECFSFHQKGELMTKENAMYCDICNVTCDSYYISKIYKPSKYLILILNRGKGNIYQCNVIFPEILDLKNFIVGQNCNTMYDLYAVICHFGPSSMGGHFIAYCRNALNDKWYCYNDSAVTLCIDKNFLNGVPYILFYQEINVA